MSERRRRPSGAPETDALWGRLSPAALAAVAEVDAARLETERARVSPRVAEKITSPVHSVRRRFQAWERLARALEAGPGTDAAHTFSDYPDELDNRDGLAAVMAQLPQEVRAELEEALTALDERFFRATDPDTDGTLDPWLHTARSRAPRAHEWWWRVPRNPPWQ